MEIMTELVLEVVGRTIMVIYLFVIEKQIVERQEWINETSRRIQDALKIPECLWIVGNAEPGIDKGTIRVHSTILSIFFIISSMLMCASIALQDLWVPSLGVIILTCITCVLCLSILLHKRTRLKQLADCGHVISTDEGFKSSTAARLSFVA